MSKKHKGGPAPIPKGNRSMPDRSNRCRRTFRRQLMVRRHRARSRSDARNYGRRRRTPDRAAGWEARGESVTAGLIWSAAHR